MLFPIIFLVLMNVDGATVTGNTGLAKILMVVFFLIGIAMSAWGILDIIKIVRIRRNGEVCYGKIIRLVPNGAFVNGRTQVNVEAQVYVESEHRMITAKTARGYDADRWFEDTYILAKYYDGGIHITDALSSVIEIPGNILANFEEQDQVIPQADNVEQGDSGNVVYESSIFNYDYEVEPEKKAQKAEQDDIFANEAYMEMIRHSDK